MRQTTICVPLEVKPASCSRLSALIVRFRLSVEGSADAYKLIAEEVPTVHFMAMSVFPHDEYDPMFVLEANFDGPPSVFWGQLSAVFGEQLRAMLRCCKRPLDEDAILYDAVTEEGSRRTVAAYLEARTQTPSAFHHGNRGLTRDRILDDEKLFYAVRERIDGTDGRSPYRGLSPEAARRQLRSTLVDAFPWLAEPRPKRIGAGENLLDFLRVAAFAAVVLFLLSLPGLMLAPLLPAGMYFAILAIAAITIAGLLFTTRRGLPGMEVPSDAPRVKPSTLLLILGLIVIATIATALFLLPLTLGWSHLLAWMRSGSPVTLGSIFWPTVRASLLGACASPLTLGLILLRVRYLERRDSSRDAPEIDEGALREIVQREDWIAQNHMGSIVLIKPGVLRTIIVRAGHLGLGLILRVVARDGYLGSMRTIHFAHWAFLNNGSRLLFHSNFDHSWDSYLDDFIEKASKGLTFAWSAGVGFPPARFLILDGAAHGRLFKSWALASRSVSRFWYSAYRHLTVDQIERNHRIANGLRPERLPDAAARAWMRDI